LQPIDQPLNPTIPLTLRGNLAAVLGDRIVKVAHAPQPVNDSETEICRCKRPFFFAPNPPLE
jgi:hypothetical protein